jgi:putative transposase
MPWSLKRYQESNQSHFLTFSCYRRQQKFQESCLRDLFVRCLEQTRVRFGLRVYGFVVMPEHVHLLISEPDVDLLASAVQSLKLAMAKRAPAVSQSALAAPPFWQRRYYDHNIPDYEKFEEKLRYIHCNPVTRGLVEKPEDWAWSSFRHYASGEAGIVEIESEWTASRRQFEVRLNSVPTEETTPR